MATGREVHHEFDEECAACAMVDRLMKASAGRWRDLTEALRQESAQRQSE